MSDFEDEEGVDEPVLDDENEDEGQEEEEVRVSKNLSHQYSCLLLLNNLTLAVKLGFYVLVLARFLSLTDFHFVYICAHLEAPGESPNGGNVSGQPFFTV